MNKKIETMMREAGVNPALPHLIFSPDEGVVFASKRMCILLSTFDEKLFGLGEKKMAQLWPFANQDDAGGKIFSKLIKTAPIKIEAQFSLQNYALESHPFKDGRVVIVAKLLRKGDLMSDKQSRQELFRTLAHELRTTAMALEGYVQMLNDLENDKDAAAKKLRGEVMDRMFEISKRLGKNVNLLDNLRDQLSSDKTKEKSKDAA